MRALLLTLILLTGCVTVAHAPEPEQTAFQMVCGELELNCSGVKPPIIVVTQLVDELFCFMCTFHGLTFEGEPYVFVNSMSPPQQQARTEYHEVVHYVLFQTGQPVTRCQSEYVARKLTSIHFGYEYNDDWRKGYRCEIEE